MSKDFDDSGIPNSRKCAHVEEGLNDDDAPAALTILKPDEKVWLDDGNVVIGAETTAFRVHRSVLSLNSDVLRDMFTVPPPTNNGQEMMEGCPVVRVSDTAADMRHMLQALYGGNAMLSEYKTKVEFKVVAALLRMAHKYQIGQLHDGALARIKALYVDDFMSYVAELDTYPSLTYSHSDPFEVVQLARLTQTHSLLPAALYLCCAGSVFEDPQVIVNLLATRNCHNDSDSVGIGHEELVYYMPKEDFVRCLTARPNLVHASVQVFAETVAFISDGCTTRPKCNKALDYASNRRLVRKLCTGTPDVRCLEPSFVHLKHAIEAGYNLCPTCYEYRKQQDLTARHGLWEELPRYFGLEIPGWPMC